MLNYRPERLTPAQIEREREVAGGLAQSTRELVDAVIRSTVADEEMLAVQAEIEALTARLRASEIDGPYGVTINKAGEARNWGNSVVGVRNPIAPPVQIERIAQGKVRADFVLGAAYEGPPELVHGGVSALILDQMCGAAAAAAGTPGMTASLSMTYKRGTPLGALQAEAAVVRTEDHKTYVEAHIADTEGPTVLAEALFVLPRWARELLDKAPSPLSFE